MTGRCRSRRMANTSCFRPIAVADWERDPQNSEVFSVDVATQKLTQLTTREGPDNSPVVSPDGKNIAYLGYDDRYQGYQVTHLYVMDIDGRNSRAVSGAFRPRHREPALGRRRPRHLLHLRRSRRARSSASSSLDGKVRTIAEGLGGTDLGRPYTSGMFSVARNGRVGLHAQHAGAAGGRRHRHRPGGATRVLTALNDDLLGNKTLGAVRELTWKSSKDQREIQGWVITPPDFDPAKKYPLILEIHGGPFAAYGPNYTTELQLYRGRGLHRAVCQSARQHELWRGVRQSHPSRLSGRRLRRPDVGRRCADRAGQCRCRQPVRHRRFRRRRAHRVDRRQDRSLPRGGGRQAGDQLGELRADLGLQQFLLPLLVRRAALGAAARSTGAARRCRWWAT